MTKHIAPCILLALAPFAATAQIAPLTQDTYVSPGSALNYGTATTLNVGGAANSQALVQFDLSMLPAGLTSANISRAALTLFVTKLAAPGTVNVSLANGPWTETGANGNNAPVAGAVVASGVAVNTSNSYITVDATSAVQSWLSGTTNSGFIVTPDSAGVNVAFDSKESSTTSHPALLTISLTSVGPAGPAGPTGATGPAGPAGATGPAGPAGNSAASQPMVWSSGFNFISGSAGSMYLPLSGSYYVTDSNITQFSQASNSGLEYKVTVPQSCVESMIVTWGAYEGKGVEVDLYSSAYPNYSPIERTSSCYVPTYNSDDTTTCQLSSGWNLPAGSRIWLKSGPVGGNSVQPFSITVSCK